MSRIFNLFTLAHIYIDEEPVIVTGCEHCPPGVSCDPTTGACIKGKCITEVRLTRNFNIYLKESVAVLPLIPHPIFQPFSNAPIFTLKLLFNCI